MYMGLLLQQKFGGTHREIGEREKSKYYFGDPYIGSVYVKCPTLSA
jgi:hypothetical protein